MTGVNRSLDQSPSRRPGLEPAVLGTACCIVSALCYTASNICMRRLAALEADEMWVTCIKETVSVAVIGPWLLVRLFRGRKVLPSVRLLVVLLLTGLAVQLAGNISLQWAYGVVGMAITMTAVFGVMLVVSAMMGRFFLGEEVSARSAAAIGLLVGSIGLLCLGAASAPETVADPEVHAAQAAEGADASSRWTMLAVGAACLAGVMFATLSTVVRFAGTAKVPVASIVFVITAVGVVTLGSLSVWRLGSEQLADTPPEQFAWMVAAGSCNLIAFLAITKGLQLTTVVHANILNASQVALGAMAGVVLFAESLSHWSIMGICLTIVGIILFGQPDRQDREIPAV